MVANLALQSLQDKASNLVVRLLLIHLKKCTTDHIVKGLPLDPYVIIDVILTIQCLMTVMMLKPTLQRGEEGTLVDLEVNQLHLDKLPRKRLWKQKYIYHHNTTT